MRFFEEALLSQSFYKQLEDAVRTHTLPGAVSGLSSFLLSGDICITMGAGDNRKLIGAVVSALRGHKGER